MTLLSLCWRFLVVVLLALFVSLLWESLQSFYFLRCCHLRFLIRTSKSWSPEAKRALLSAHNPSTFCGGPISPVLLAGCCWLGSRFNFDCKSRLWWKMPQSWREMRTIPQRSSPPSWWPDQNNLRPLVKQTATTLNKSFSQRFAWA